MVSPDSILYTPEREIVMDKVIGPTPDTKKVKKKWKPPAGFEIRPNNDNTTRRLDFQQGSGKRNRKTKKRKGKKKQQTRKRKGKKKKRSVKK